MKRREAFKKIGLMSIVGLSGMALVSCGTEQKEVVPAAPKEVSPTPKPKTEREKLIINREKYSFVDPENPTDAELKHTPSITFGDQDEKGNTLVTVTIGSEGIIHPAIKEHWIDYMIVYVNDIIVAESEFKNGGIRGFGNYYMLLEKGDTVKVESGCNLHGIWENSSTF